MLAVVQRTLLARWLALGLLAQAFVSTGSGDVVSLLQLQQDAAPRLASRSWSDADAKAAQVLSKLEPSERYSLMRGQHYQQTGPEPGYYRGTTGAVGHLGIPALKFADSPSGFHNPSLDSNGTTTMWPCLLALASSWDEELVGDVAAAVATEFRGKGANAMLGPRVAVQRSAQSGESFDSISGEDPYLGSRMVKSYVQGVLTAGGVMPIVKGFGSLDQERDIANSLVSDRAAFELYYPPVEAAIEAGVPGVMCDSYKVNNTHACENQRLLHRDLRSRMGFRGFVMSNWFATTSTSVGNLDMEMPGLVGFRQSWFTDGGLTFADQQAVAQSARRILRAIYRFRLEEQPGCTPPCHAALLSSQTSEAHDKLARKAATTAVTLLKNDGVLPLLNEDGVAKVKTVALLGAAASVNGTAFPRYYSGNGPLFVPPRYAITPLQAIMVRAKAAGVEVLHDSSNLLREAVKLANKADIVIVVAAASTPGDYDRVSLSLDSGADLLVSTVAAIRPTVVLLETPGAVLTPWRNQVAAILNLFFAGQEAGSALAAVVFGDASPEGKLPIMLPATLEDTIQVSAVDNVEYTEGLYTSYRNPNFTAAFPFGHGLSYTTFELGKPWRESSTSVHLNITNVGRRAGTEVVQAYLSFKSSQPVTPMMMLRGFQKVRLQPGEQKDIAFQFSQRDLSTYSNVFGGWVPQTKDVHVRIGVSSEDIRHELQLM